MIQKEVQSMQFLRVNIGQELLSCFLSQFLIWSAFKDFAVKAISKYAQKP